MGQQQNKPGLLGKLVENQEKITESMKWKDLGDSERIERLREYTKKTFAEIIERQQKQLERLEQRIRILEVHEHDEKGMPVIRTPLNQAKAAAQTFGQPEVPYNYPVLSFGQDSVSGEGYI